MPEERKHFDDVARPGTTTPQHTSRPIIPSKTDRHDDPMVTPHEPRGSVAKKLFTTHEASDEEKLDNQTNAQEVSPSDEPSTTTNFAGLDTVAETKPEQKTTQSDTSKVDDLIAKKTYNLPISPSKQKRTALTIIIAMLVITLGVVTAFIILG